MNTKEKINMATTKKSTSTKTAAKVTTTAKTSAVKVAAKAQAAKTTVRKSVATKPAAKKPMVAAQPIEEVVKTLPVPTPVADYKPDVIEPRWQTQWEQDQLYRSVIDHDKKKFYALTMLPYPSGNLHIGHWYAMTPSDARARYMRMRGYNVMFPMGFDAFGLPAENAAIKDRLHPMKRTYANIQNMRQQLRSMGAMFDWERECVSCDPEYYR